MFIVIVVKKSLKRCFGDVRKTAVGAGILGVMVFKKKNNTSSLGGISIYFVVGQ